MKTTLVFLAAAISVAFASISGSSAQSFTLSITPNEETIAVGDSATFTVSVQTSGGFDATVFLTKQTTYPNGSTSLNADFGAINQPYTPITFTKYPQSTTDTGTYIIIVTGTNGQLISTAQCILHISNNPVWKWKVVNSDADRWGNRIIRGNSGAVIGIEQLNGGKLRLNTFEKGEWNSQTLYAPGFYDDHGFARYKLGKEGTLWASSNGSIYRFKNNLTTVWSSQTGLNLHGNQIDFALDSNGLLPALKAVDDSNNVAIYRFSGGQWQKMYSAKNSEEERLDEMPKICIDSAGSIWTLIATNNYRCVLRLNGATSEIFPKSSFGNDWFWGIFCDRQGKVWCIHGSKPVHASVFDGSVWTSVDFPSLSVVSAVEVDSKNNIWVGSVGKLFQYDGTQWTEYNTSNAPLDDIITGLVADCNDNIWIAFGQHGSHAGVIFNPTGLKGIPITLSAEIPATYSELSLFPNPTSESFTVHCAVNAVVTVRDVFGRLLYSGTGSEISTVCWPAGVYFVEAASGGKRSVAKAVVLR